MSEDETRFHELELQRIAIWKRSDGNLNPDDMCQYRSIIEQEAKLVGRPEILLALRDDPAVELKLEDLLYG